LGGKLEDKELRKYASQAGLDLGRFDHEMSINLYAEEILRNLEFSINHGITGTPTFFVNDVLWAVTGVKLIESVKALAERPGSVKDTETN
jgi:protein-disulfide isomerase